MTTQVLITGKNINELQIKAKATLDYMSEWLLVNSWPFNKMRQTIKLSSEHYQDKTFLIIKIIQ